MLLLSLLGLALAAILVSCPQVKPAGGRDPSTRAPEAADDAVPKADAGTRSDTASDGRSAVGKATDGGAAAGGAAAGGAATGGAVTGRAPAPDAESATTTTGRIAFVIDDAGYDLDALQPFLDLPVPLAVAVLPNATHGAEAARRVVAAGKELLLHLPMEPEGEEDPGPGALLAGMMPAAIEELLDRALASVPGAVGVNNHMGSRATADRAFMAALLDALDRRGLYFIDSRTTSLTVAASEADRLGVPCLERTVFLDAVEGEVAQSLSAAIDAASRGGIIVAIGHVQSEGLADAVRRTLDGMTRAGVRPSTTSSLVAAARGRVE